jgi:hypothetical protein
MMTTMISMIHIYPYARGGMAERGPLAATERDPRGALPGGQRR